MERQKLSPEVVQRVRQYLAQGLRIGTEHADSRRYRSGVWQTCSPIQSTNESEVFKALEACLAEHADEYVRMFGIDPQAKQRVAPVTIQRPDGKAVAIGNGSGSSGANANGSYYRPAPQVAANSSNYSNYSGSLPAEVVQQVRQYINQGYKIGTEHADSRRYRSNVWQTCSPIQSPRESEVISALEACLSEHSGEYVRMFGIDPQAKRRVAPVTIQRPDGKPVQVNAPVPGSVSGGSSRAYSSGGHSGSSHSGGGQLSGDVAQQVRQLLNQGYKIGAEHADTRRYRSNVWQTCPPINTSREGDVVAAVQACMADHAGEYVRIFGIDPQAKRRVSTVTVQRPGQGAPASSNSSSGGGSAAATASSYGAAAASSNGHRDNLSQDVAQQVSQLVNQGYRVSWEHADSRRYRSGAWKTGGAIEGSRVSEILSALEAQLSSHAGEYVRLVGIDPKAKRRVLETTIQRP